MLGLQVGAPAFARSSSGNAAPIWYVQGANTTLQGNFGVAYAPSSDKTGTEAIQSALKTLKKKGSTGGSSK